MKNARTLFVLAFITSAAFLCSPSLAADKPVELKSLIKSERAHGQTMLTWFFMDVYKISLWLDGSNWTLKKPFAISILYLMTFTTADLVDKTISEMQRLGAPKASLEAYRNKLIKVFPTVNSGDRITAHFDPSLGVTFFYNGAKTGLINDALFAQYFSYIWLSPQTEIPEVREQLLNGVKG